MLYSILLYVSEDAVAALGAQGEEEHVARHLLIHEKLAAQGKLGPCARLMGTSTAKRLHTAGGPRLMDGPYAETKEALLGFYIVDVESEEEAIAVARSLPSVDTVFEIRPVKLYFPGCGLK